VEFDTVQRLRNPPDEIVPMFANIRKNTRGERFWREHLIVDSAAVGQRTVVISSRAAIREGLQCRV
jgi:hypothetical protein